MSEHIFNLRKNRPSIFGTGLIALDVILNDDDQHSQQVAAGGTCGNVLTILSYLEWDSYPLSRLNGDTASQRVLNDLAHWGVHLTFSSLEPSSRTPIIVQRIKKTSAGKPYHRFSLRCPECGNYLPHYQAVIADAVEPLIGKIKPSVFFMDRVSRGALMLAKASSQEGAIVVFEPSKIKDEKNVREALALAHILKYSHEKIPELNSLNLKSRFLLEIQTLGDKGLRYRSAISTCQTKGWKTVEPFPSQSVRDTSGAGDWCTAGIIHLIGQKGVHGLKRLTSKKLLQALQFGQALANWNCRFEGARGGMYKVQKETFINEVKGILEKKVQFSPSISLAHGPKEDIFALLCAGCKRARSQKSR